MELIHPLGNSAEENSCPDGTVLECQSAENQFAQTSEILVLCYQENTLWKFTCLPWPNCLSICLQQRSQWSALRPWWSHLTWWNCELLQSHTWFMVSSPILLSDVYIPEFLGAPLLVLCAARNVSALGLFPRGNSPMLSIWGQILGVEHSGMKAVSPRSVWGSV